MEPGPPAEEESALVVRVPGAEPLVGKLRERHDPSAIVGVPAHVTILYPFVPPSAIDDALRGQLRALFAELEAFDYRFARVERFGDRTVYLAPEPRARFTDLIEAAVARWPAYPPYGGVFDEVVPHLTVGDMLEPGMADRIAADAGRALARRGPIAGRAHAVSLLAERDGHWFVDSTHPLRDG